MNAQDFRASLTADAAPSGLSEVLQALWWDAKGDWDKAHDHAQARDDEAGAHVHAYLHRKEGDQSNANYWYRRARVSPFSGTLEAEWASLLDRYLPVDRQGG